MAYITPYNWSSGNLALLSEYHLVRITGAGAGSSILTLPQVTSSANYIEYGYQIKVVDTGGFVTGVQVAPSPLDTGYLIDGATSISWTKTNGGL